MGMLVAFSRSTADIDSCVWNGRMIDASTGDTEKLRVTVPTTSSSSTMPSAGANASFRGALARWNACAWASAALRAQSAHCWPVLPLQDSTGGRGASGGDKNTPVTAATVVMTVLRSTPKQVLPSPPA